MAKVWTRNEIDALLNTNARAVEEGILRLYELQTRDEQTGEYTQYRNNVGFSSCHARTGSYWAKVIKKSTAKPGHRLWGKGLEKCRRIALKHSRQLTELANAKEAAKEQPAPTIEDFDGPPMVSQFSHEDVVEMRKWDESKNALRTAVRI